MNPENSDPNDPRLSALLRAARGTPSLPPRFQDNVWRRIESAEAPAKSGSWLDALAALVLRPRFAIIATLLLVSAGGWWGAHTGVQTARQEAQARYLAAVAPNYLH